ncbi:hypothetical protein BC941DRAFT_413809 [Chlamydoabsidia padenii]|nr:hypothetical protein BC941DRAFT_413809 [Chlamydoabsidia padenii]
MNDCYTPTMGKDPSSPNSSANYIPLYHHEQVPFQSFQLRPSHSFKAQQNTSSPNLTNNSNNSNNNSNNDNNTNSCDLQDIILCYQSQPDLLRLILSSKLEEDKRRAEEAKLKAKELDLLLLQQQQQMMTPALSSPSTSSSSSTTIPPASIATTNDHSNAFSYPPFSFQQPMDTSSFNNMNHPLNTVTSPSLQRRPPSPSTMEMKKGGHAMVFDTDERSSFPPASSPSSFLPMAEHQDGMKQPSVEPFMDDLTDLRYDTAYPYPSQHHHPYHHPHQNSTRPRRRREMQAITKIVETRDYPYLDGHSWRNNGNTVQKKTGNKSVYYKCANSIKGCGVNKTLTWRGNGEYLIKYRGEHLPECSIIDT